ncbi:MAG: ClpX C4-type zinc finger protein [Acidobacteriota bacterium]
MDGHVLNCTFCKRSEHQVGKLVAGAGVYICDRCIEIAHAIIHDQDHGPMRRQATSPRVGERLRRLASRLAGRSERRQSGEAVS